MASSGINTPQYKRVRKNYATLTGFLQNHQQVKQNLFNEFVAKNWTLPGDCPSEGGVLINIAMERIKTKPTEYDIFLSILEQIPGTDNILEILKGAACMLHLFSLSACLY